MRFFMYLSYDGARYHGWQIQPNGISVQEVLSKALSTLLRQPIEVTGAGRTDAGVNAELMVAHFEAPLPQPPSPPIGRGELSGWHSSPQGGRLGGGCRDEGEGLLFISRLNKFLPPDIVVHKIVPVRADAHARFSATSRTYYYYIITEKSPFEPYAYRFPQPLDFDKMNEAAQTLFDYTDFTSFSKLHTDVKTNNCRITFAQWEQVSPIKWRFTITADRFLRNMVRAIVGTLLDVGRGVLSIDGFRKIIEQKDRCSAGTSVPGNALFLADVSYPEELFEV